MYGLRRRVWIQQCGEDVQVREEACVIWWSDADVSQL